MANNETCYQRQKVLEVLRSLDTIVTSLDRIGSATASLPMAEQAEVLVQFFDEWDVFARLAAARRILSEPFSSEIGDDQMDELEREMCGVPRWRSDQRKPPNPKPDPK